jgi:putative transcriptional regulator
MSDAQYLSGRLLLAMPGMFDPRFARAVIAMFVHDSHGALGIGIGRVHDSLRFRAILEEAGIDPGDAPDAPVHLGGPVEPQRGFVVHTPDWGGQGTIVTEPLGALSFATDVLRAIAEGRGPSRWLFALGYAGWGEGQLDGEMRQHGWHAAAGRADVLFDTPADKRWAAVWQGEGIDPALLASETGRA